MPPSTLSESVALIPSSPPPIIESPPSSYAMVSTTPEPFEQPTNSNTNEDFISQQFDDTLVNNSPISSAPSVSTPPSSSMLYMHHQSSKLGLSNNDEPISNNLYNTDLKRTLDHNDNYSKRIKTISPSENNHFVDNDVVMDATTPIESAIPAKGLIHPGVVITRQKGNIPFVGPIYQKTPADVDPSKRSVMEFTASPSEKRLSVRALISTKEAGIIIGKRGKNVMDIKIKSGSTVVISNNDPPCVERIVTITGTVDSVAKSFALIANKLMTENKNGPLPNCALRLLVPNCRMGSLIGAKGATIREIQEVSRTEVKASESVLPGSSERSVTVSGLPEGICTAVASIARILLDNAGRSTTSLVLYSPPPITRSYSSDGYQAPGYQQQYHGHHQPQQATSAAAYGYHQQYANYPASYSAAGYQGYSHGASAYAGGYYSGAASNAYGAAHAHAGYGAHHHQQHQHQQHAAVYAAHYAASAATAGHQSSTTPTTGNTAISSTPASTAGTANGAVVAASQVSYYAQPTASPIIHVAPEHQHLISNPNTQVVVSKKMASAIIGAKGVRINEIRTLSGCSIKIDEIPDMVDTRLINVIGSTDATRMAMFMLKNRIDTESAKAEL